MPSPGNTTSRQLIAACGFGLAAAMGALAAAAAPEGFQAVIARPHGQPDARIAYGSLPQQFGQLWRPGGPGDAPVVVLIHGGCWLASLPGLELMEPMADDLRRHGYAVWNIEYRRIGQAGGGYPGTFLDVAQAIDRLAAMAKPYRLDLRRVAVVGHSAGGQLALWAAARGSLPPGSPLQTIAPLAVAGVVSLAGIDDLRSYRENGPAACGGPGTIDALVDVAGRRNRDVYADTSPAALTAARVPQTIVSGALDPIVPSRFERDYAALARAGGAEVTEAVLPQAGHFELMDPASGAWPTIRQLITDRLKP